jgi:hypothetical protein
VRTVRPGIENRAVKVTAITNAVARTSTKMGYPASAYWRACGDNCGQCRGRRRQMANPTALVPGTEGRVIATFWRVAAGYIGKIVRCSAQEELGNYMRGPVHFSSTSARNVSALPYWETFRCNLRRSWALGVFNCSMQRHW